MSTALQTGELVLLERRRDLALVACAAAFKALQRSRQDGTYTEQASADYWTGPFYRFQVLEAQVLGLEPLTQATIDRVAGRN